MASLAVNGFINGDKRQKESYQTSYIFSLIKIRTWLHSYELLANLQYKNCV